MVKITQLHVLPHHHLRLVFDDGVEKIIDMTPFMREDSLTKPLSDPDFFSQVKIYENGRGIYWPNDYDVCPDNLRYHIESAGTPIDSLPEESLQTA